MQNKFFSVIPKMYLVMMGILTSWFLAQLAMADPLCTGCSVNLVQWAMPRAEILVFGWLIAGMGAVWVYRKEIIEYCRMLKGDTQETESN